MEGAMKGLSYELCRHFEKAPKRTRVVPAPKIHKFFGHVLDYLKMWGVLFAVNEEGIEGIQSLFDRIERNMLGLHIYLRVVVVVQRIRNRLYI